jgi:hypothetical protein
LYLAYLLKCLRKAGGGARDPAVLVDILVDGAATCCVEDLCGLLASGMAELPARAAALSTRFVCLLGDPECRDAAAEVMMRLLALENARITEIALADLGAIETIFVGAGRAAEAILKQFACPEKVFAALVVIADMVDSERYADYFGLLGTLVTPSCEVKAIVRRCPAILEGDGVCSFLEAVFREVASAAVAHPQLVPPLLRSAFSSPDG